MTSFWGKIDFYLEMSLVSYLSENLNFIREPCFRHLTLKPLSLLFSFCVIGNHSKSTPMGNMCPL